MSVQELTWNKSLIPGFGVVASFVSSQNSKVMKFRLATAL